EHGEPLIFGIKRKRAVVQSGFGFEVVDVDDNLDPESIVRHDAHCEDPAYAFALSRLSGSDLAHTPMGIFRQVQRPTYDSSLQTQLHAAIDQGPNDLQELLRGKDTWTVA
ncbi:MAG: 2-oxoacid:ferredoxin oxidoreductase subunit beta, partial [Antricoccus sp.]